MRNKENEEWVDIVVALIHIFAFPAFIMLIWNGVIANIFNLPRITYWNAFWVRILIGLLWDDTYIGTRLDRILKELEK